MENNIFDLLLFPEFVFLIGIILILLIGLFKTKNVFSTTSNLSVILLIAVAAASAVGLFGVSVTGLFTFNFPAKLA